MKTMQFLRMSFRINLIKKIGKQATVVRIAVSNQNCQDETNCIWKYPGKIIIHKGIRAKVPTSDKIIKVCHLVINIAILINSTKHKAVKVTAEKST